MYIYRTYFNLLANVLDINDAQEYLSEDDMSEYLKETTSIDENVRIAVESIEWVLKDENSGYIELKTNRGLFEKELKAISEWVTGQNSDGLGEGFEQQSFAHYPDESVNYGIGGGENDDFDDYDEYDWIMASFDWQTNDYIFEFVRKD